MSAHSLVHEWSRDNAHYRLVRFGNAGEMRAIERRFQDRLGGTRWEEVLAWNQDRWADSIENMEIVRAFCAAVEPLAEAQRALAESMNYARGERHG